MKLAALTFSLSLTAFMLLISSAVVLAQQAETRTPTVATPTAPTTAQTPASTPGPEMNARVEARRNRLAKLTPAETANIKGRCVAAQAKAEAVSRKISDSQQPYQTKYEAYAKKLKDLQQKLKDAGQDTTEINAQITTLDQKYQAYKTSLDQLSLAMGDLKLIDCKNEPKGFKATLEEARNQIKTVQTSRKEVNAFAKDSFTKSLQTIKANVEAKTTTESSKP